MLSKELCSFCGKIGVNNLNSTELNETVVP